MIYARRWSRNEMREAIAVFYVEHGRTPTAKEWSRPAADRPTANTLKYHFGSFNAALRAAGFTPRRPGQHGPNLVRYRDRLPLVENGASPEAELSYLISEQAKDSRIGFYSFAVDATCSRFKHRGFYSDAWTDAVIHYVDRARWIDSVAEAA